MEDKFDKLETLMGKMDIFLATINENYYENEYYDPFMEDVEDMFLEACSDEFDRGYAVALENEEEFERGYEQAMKDMEEDFAEIAASNENEELTK